MSKKVGIYAGSFDPIHKGHLAFAEAALAHGLDKVFFLVEPRPRRKQGVRAFEHRLAMASLAVKNKPKMGVIHLDQALFTPHKTLPLLAARFKGNQLYLLFGDDVIDHMIDNLAEWPHVEDIAKSANLLIGARLHKSPELAERLKDLRQYGVKFKFEFLELGKSDINSTKIRAALKRGQDHPGVPAVVLSYIKKQRLYASTDDSTE